MKSSWLISLLVFSALVLLIQGKTVLFKREPKSIHDSLSHLHRHEVLHNAHHLTPKTPINIARHIAGPSPTGNELVAIREYLALFGVENPKAELSLHRVLDDGHFADHTVRHYHQYYHGIRVDAGDIRLFVNDEKEITHVFGTFIPNLKVDTTVLVKAKQAKNVAKTSRSKTWGGIPTVVDSIELVIHVSGLPSGRRISDNVAWKVEVSNSHRRATVFVDAHTGEIIDIYERHYDALNRVVRKGNPTGQLIFTEGDPLPTGEPEALSILSASALIYNNFKNSINRLSYDGNDAQMKIVVELFDASGTTCPNAFWDSTQIQFCTGLATTDVTIHEWGHAYTEFTHNLVYAAQSGALNEAYSDILAEAIQNMNNAPVAFSPRPDFTCLSFATAGPAARKWIVGDEVASSVFGTDGLRDMYNPNCLNQPRSVSDTTFDCSFASQTCDESNDQCGVHGNSGVPNQAFSLLADGGILNGVTVVGIGSFKAFHIYVRAMVSLQTSTTTFNQHSTALATACSQLTGASILSPVDGSALPAITAADCTQVSNALAATQMSAAVCSTPPPPSTSNKVLFVEPKFAPTASNVATTFFVDVSGKVATNPTCVFRTGPTPATAPSTGVRTNEATGVIIVTCDIPASLTGLGTYDVFIGDSSGNVDIASTSNAKVNVIARPDITAISPKNGPTTATTLVTLTGTGFVNLDAPGQGCYSVPISDVNGDSVDCLSTVPGNFDLNFPVKVTYENPTTVTFKMPPVSLLVGTETCFLVPFSLNTQIYMLEDTIGFNYGSTPFTDIDSCGNVNPSSSTGPSSSTAPSKSSSTSTSTNPDNEVCVRCGPTCVLNSFKKRCTKKLGGFVTRGRNEICCNFSNGLPSSFSFGWNTDTCSDTDKQKKLQALCEGLGGSATCTNPGLWTCSS